MLDPWYLDNLGCTRDHSPLNFDGHDLISKAGQHYPVANGIPVMLREDVPMTTETATASLRRANGEIAGDPRLSEFYLETLGIDDAEKNGIVELAAKGSKVDPVVSYLVAATNGLMYRHLRGQLDRYPIPRFPLPPGGGKSLLDVGCGWGRWCFSAAMMDYNAVGIDPSLGAASAGCRVAAELGVPVRFVVGDARYLPFRDATFDCVYSYSVIQHFSREDARQAVKEIGRVLKPGGTAVVQMPTRFGVRCLYHQARRRFREGVGFDVRYWSLTSLHLLFNQFIGPCRSDVDCFFGIGLQSADADLMPHAFRLLMRASDVTRAASHAFPPLRWIADSVFMVAHKAPG
jgi:SAM-dependent methyltransferase/uncharacterized protein YbaR (Trm112 family)